MITVLIIVLVVVALILLSGHPYKAINKERSDSYYYNFYKNQVRYVPMGNWFELDNRKLNSIDLKTVEVLGRKYIKDKDAVYFQDTKIINADVNSFVVVDNFYAKDKNKVYYCSNSFQDIDVNTFEFVKDDYIVIKDKKHRYSICFRNYDTYSNTNQVIHFLPEGLVFLSANYSKDNKHVYYKGRVIEGADTRTFVLVYYGYAKDVNNVYYDGSLLAGADAENFTCIGNHVKDTRKIYYYGKEVRGLDVASFVAIGDSAYTKDANGVYYGFKGVYDSARQATHYIAVKMEAADPRTFEVLIKSNPQIDAEDKQKKYLRGRAK